MPFDKEDKVDEATEVETQATEFDTGAAVAEISADLFGQGKEAEVVSEETPIGAEKEPEGEGKQPSGEGNDGNDADAVVAPPQSTEENSAEVQETGAPKTWTKEALQDWATIPDRAKQEILKREQDFLNGISQYKEAAELGQSYDKVVEPYRPLLAAENVDPVNLFQSFAANHYLLSKGTVQQKVEIAASLLDGYGIPLVDLLNYIGEKGDVKPIDPELKAVRDELNELKGTITSRQTAEYNARQAEIEKEIDAFAADPANIYFDEVAEDISKLFASGIVKTLPEAYEKAVYANPSTRQKEIDRLTAERTSQKEAEEAKRKQKVASSTADNIVTTPKSKDGTVPVGSMDDTLRETMASIESRAS